MTFLMQPEKDGRVPYLLMTLAPALLIRWIIPGTVGAIAFLAVAAFAGFFLVLQKNHTIEISDISIFEKDWRGTGNLILPGKIHSLRKNLLHELLLLDENGTVLICIEPNMSNRKLLELWLESHNIKETNKE